MNGSNYENAEELEIVTLENAIYLAMRNDLAYVFHDELFLYEQQSSKNGNMPLRCLFYVSDSYSKMVRDKNLYGSKQIKIPAPTFVVFYNGKERIEEGEVRLSEAYTQKTENPNLELRVKICNINLGNNKEIYEKSHTMREYMIFVDKVRRYSEERSLDAAIDQAVEECIGENILRDFLMANKAEVKKMCLYEYDEERQRKWDREDGGEEKRDRMVEILLRQKVLSDEKIMEAAEISEEELKQIKKKMEG